MSTTGIRVTGGRLGGRRLRTPRHGVRPTADRVRESLFTRLGDLTGTSVLDLYAGTGVLGAEAASRGAARVLFVERATRCCEVLRANVAALGLGEIARVVRDDAVRAVGRLGRSGERFDLVFVDPPYASQELPRVLEALSGSGVLAAGALVVVEHGRRHSLPVVAGLAVRDQRIHGETAMTWLAAEPDRQQGGPSGA